MQTWGITWIAPGDKVGKELALVPGMTQIARNVLVAAAFLLALSGTADAQRAAKSAKSAKAKDGRSARAAVIKNYKAKGRSTNIRVTKSGVSKSGKSMQVLVHSKGSGKVRALNVRKSNGVAYETKTQAKTQASARKAANQKLRRQDGTFSGVNSAGLSNSGKSYKFNSATDRAPKTGDKAYVNAKSGKVRTSIKGK